MNALTEVRCCCNPENLIGYVPEHTDGLLLREMTDGSRAFDSNHNAEAVRKLPGFVPNLESWQVDTEGLVMQPVAAKTTWKKTGTKTWRKK